MLKNLNPLLNPDLLYALAAMGHGDEIAIVDANYPSETDARCLIRMEGASAPALLDAVLTLLPVDDFVADAVFCPAMEHEPWPDIHHEFARVLKIHEPQRQISTLAGKAFYDRVRGTFALVASGEPRLYGNIIIRKGVIRP